MRLLAAALICLPFSACIFTPSMVLTNEECVEMFQRYDFELERAVLDPWAENPRPWNSNEIERLETFIRNGLCLTSQSQIDPILAASADFNEFRATNQGNPVPPQSLHLGTLTSHQAVLDFVSLLEGLGYSVTTVPGTDLGRRVYLQNLTTDKAIVTAYSMGEAMGLRAVYLGPVEGLFY